MECVVMGQGYRRGFAAAEKTELWDRWQRGESLKAIGRAFGKPSSSIYFQLAPHGGIRPAHQHCYFFNLQKSRQTFYPQIQFWSFHTAKTQLRHRQPGLL
jgi:hypothetical protein